MRPKNINKRDHSADVCNFVDNTAECGDRDHVWLVDS